MGGDFNLVLEVDKDKKGGLAKTHKKSPEVIADFVENLELIDAWRVLNPEISRFTWRQKKPEVHCRLDFFFVNQTTFCNTVSADIVPGYKTELVGRVAHKLTRPQVNSPTPKLTRLQVRG